MDGPEIEFALEGPWAVTDTGGTCQAAALAFIDPAVGGSGYLPRIGDEFHLVAQHALEHLDHPGCETACYRCLKPYQNQRFHDILRWQRILTDLEQLAHQPPTPAPLETGDLNDPRPWLEAFATGVGSPLELKFLRLFEQNGFNPQRQVPITPRAGHAPSPSPTSP